jgi:hypothetical protein
MSLTTDNMTLFDSLEPEKRKVSGNPYHAFNGKFSAKPTLLQIANRKIAALENNQNYLVSIAVNAGEMLRIKDERIIELQKQLNKPLGAAQTK